MAASDSKSEFLEVPYIYTSGEYLYTCGVLSEFFRAIKDDKRLLGAKCPACAKVWMPARGYCPDCYDAVSWVPLSGEGTIVAHSYCYHPGMAGDLVQFLDLPYVQAMVHLDGADTYLLSAVAVKEQRMGEVRDGMRVRAVFREERKGTIADFYFEVAEQTAGGGKK